MFPLVTGRGREESELWLGSWWLQGWGLLLWDRCSWSGFWYFCLLVQTCFFTRVTHSTLSRERCTRKVLSLSRWQNYTNKLVMMIYIHMVMSTKSAIQTNWWWTMNNEHIRRTFSSNGSGGCKASTWSAGCSFLEFVLRFFKFDLLLVKILIKVKMFARFRSRLIPMKSKFILSISLGELQLLQLYSHLHQHHENRPNSKCHLRHFKRQSGSACHYVQNVFFFQLLGWQCLWRPWT